MTEKTHQQLIEENEGLKNDLKLAMALNKEREISDNRYARKIFETGFVGLIVIFALASLYFLFAHAGLPKP